MVHNIQNYSVSGRFQSSGIPNNREHTSSVESIPQTTNAERKSCCHLCLTFEWCLIRISCVKIFLSHTNQVNEERDCFAIYTLCMQSNQI
jgi:hypothetical protein